jgi:hypothetical protein
MRLLRPRIEFLRRTADVHLDIQFQGDAGSGNASFPLDGIHAFQLQRAP